MYKYYPEVKTEQTIQILTPYTQKKQIITIPPCYFLSPNGDLCNGMEDKHKYALISIIYSQVIDSFMGRKIAINDELVPISLEEIQQHDRKRVEHILKEGKITRADSNEYLGVICADLTDPKIVALTLGNIKSRIIFLDKFIKLKNNSDNPLEDIKKINNEAKSQLDDILISYCGFEKLIKRYEKNYIVTSSLHFDDFINYLDNGWLINHVPKISLDDNYNPDTVKYALNHFLNDNPEFEDKIKIIEKRP